MIDLHVHTNSSDGEYTGKEIIDLAKKVNVNILSITDHDTVEGLDGTIKYGRRRGIQVIPGIEISAEWQNNNNANMHILGYHIDYTNKDLLKAIEFMQYTRNKRNKEIVEQFNKIGVKMTLEEVASLAGSKVVAKPHFAQLLLQKGYIKYDKEAYTIYFDSKEFRCINRKKLSMKESIKVILNAGGVPVLAHPKLLELSYEELNKTVKMLKSYGLRGIECFHSINHPEQIEYSIKIAEENNLIMTGGTDFHGKRSGNIIELGRGINNNVNVPIQCIIDLENEKKRIRSNIQFNSLC